MVYHEPLSASTGALKQGEVRDYVAPTMTGARFLLVRLLSDILYSCATVYIA